MTIEAKTQETKVMTEIKLTSAQARVLRYNIKNIPDLERLHFWIDNALTLDGPCGIELIVGVDDLASRLESLKVQNP